MNTLMFFYTLAILVICIVTAVLSLAAYASSRRRFFIYGSGVFICYAIEMTEILFEYTLQNQSFPASDYYSITIPVLRTFVATASQAFIWLIAMDLLDKHSKKQFVIPVATFLLSELLIIVAVPYGPIHQWLYYTMRQVFLVFVGLYIFWTARKSTQVELKARVNNQRKHLIIGAILVGCIVAEDFYNILIVPMSLAPSWLQLYLSERSFSENVFACYFAILLIIYSYHVLSIRMQEAPEEKNVSDLDRHIEEQMPFYRNAYKLSNRETEVMRLVVLGKSNQEIADELFLAVGTVKTHIHNILVKTEQQNRTTLILHFWKR
ncbi:MAG: response regulator transcription factor [Collinsella sp.]|nr:response regulator transcription factor [Collinsella sp.]